MLLPHGCLVVFGHDAPKGFLCGVMVLSSGNELPRSNAD